MKLFLNGPGSDGMARRRWMPGIEKQRIRVSGGFECGQKVDDFESTLLPQVLQLALYARRCLALNLVPIREHHDRKARIACRRCLCHRGIEVTQPTP